MLSLTSGAISTNTSLRVGHGVLTYAEAGDASIVIYDSTAADNAILTQVTSGDARSFTNPVKFGTGCFVSVASTTGIAIVHTG